MKTKLLSGAAALVFASLVATQAGPKEDAADAAKKLAAKSYSWKTTTENAGGGGGGGGRGGAGGPQEGKISDSGFAMLTLSGGQSTTEAVIKGTSVAVKRDDAWKTLDEIAADSQGGGGGRGRGAVMGLRNFKAPAARAAELVAHVKEFKSAEGVISGDLTEEGAKSLLSFGGRGGGAGPDISDAKGSVKFWVKEGVISKMETKVQGKVSFNGNEREVDRTTTTEIKDVGTTTFTVPEEAKKKVS